MILIANGVFTVIWAFLSMYCLYVNEMCAALTFAILALANAIIISLEVKSDFRPAREYWVNVFTSSYSVAHTNRETADSHACDRKECILVREVLK